MAYVDIIWNDQKQNYLCAQLGRFFFSGMDYIWLGLRTFWNKVFNRKPHKPIDIPGWLWALQTIMFDQYQIVWHLTAKCNHIKQTTPLCGWIAQIQCKFWMKKQTKTTNITMANWSGTEKKLRETYQRRQKKIKPKKTTKNCRGKTL